MAAAGTKRATVAPDPFPATWPADAVERRPVAALVPYARNARTHSDAQVAQIAASIREWGWTTPVLVDEAGGIIAGHGRVMAARTLGIADVPVMVARGWSDAQKKAYVLADNKLALNAGWDEALLRVELEDLKFEGFDLGLTGFADLELAALLAETTEGLTDPDDVPDAPVEPVTAPGDVWVLGRHRIVCGDSTIADCVAVALNGVKPRLCLTDPPYGIGDTKSEKNDYVEYDDTRHNLISTVGGFLPLAQAECSVVVVTPGNGNTSLYPTPTWTMAWFTPAGVGRGPWGFCCWQPILCYGKDPKLALGKGCHPDAIVHTESSEDFGHPCSKPIKFWCWLMERTSEQADVIYEPFSGSGTTIIAAEMTGRACHAIELSPAYVDVAVKRWQAFTGQVATLEGDGRSFTEVEHERNQTGAAEIPGD